MKIFLMLLTMSISFISFDASAQSYSSAGCYAYTACPFGGTISCQVYGYSYAGYASGSKCMWHVIPGRQVQCRGYTQSFDHWGNTVWAWQNFTFRCPGT